MYVKDYYSHMVCAESHERDGKATAITSADFVRRWHLPSTSSVQSAMKGLLEKSFVTESLGTYEVYDKFFALWLLRQ
jgi:predicted transcriptional regulator